MYRLIQDQSRLSEKHGYRKKHEEHLEIDLKNENIYPKYVLKITRTSKHYYQNRHPSAPALPAPAVLLCSTQLCRSNGL